MTALNGFNIQTGKALGIDLVVPVSDKLRPMKSDYPELFDMDDKLGYYRTMLVETSLSNDQIAEQAEKKFGTASAFSVNWCASQLRKLGFIIMENDKRD